MTDKEKERIIRKLKRRKRKLKKEDLNDDFTRKGLKKIRKAIKKMQDA